jgi:hypothetical protein
VKVRVSRSSGFTTLEILVTLIVIGMVYAAVASGLRLVMQARAKQAALLVDSRGLVVGWQLARSVLAGMDPGSRSRPGVFVAAGDRLAFTTVLPGVPRQLVDATLLVDGDHRLVLRWVQRAAGNLGGQRILAEGVAALAIGYRGAGTIGAWVSSWHDRRLPALVRLSVAWTDHTRRPWPPVIAGPVLTTPRD